VSHTGLAVFLIFIATALTLFFSVIVISLHTFSFGKLQDAWKSRRGKSNATGTVDTLVDKVDTLALVCYWYRLVVLMGLLFLLIVTFNPIVEPATQQGYRYIAPFSLGIVLMSIFGVALPYAWAKHAGEKLLCLSYPLLSLLAVVAAPLVWLQTAYDAVIRRLAGVAHTTPQEQLEEKHEEFLTELEQHRLEGAVDEEEQEMIENVLELSESTADEIMTPRTDITAVDVNVDLKTLLDTIATAGHTRVPVYKETVDDIVGLVYAKDLLEEIGKDPAEFTLQDKLRKAYFVPETKPLRALLHEFQGQKLHIAVVLDEYGGTAGIVTLEDILEELVGEIADEYEEAPADTIERIDPDTIELDARTYVDDLNDQFHLALPEEEDYDTVGGFVFTQLGCIPKAGDSFEYQNLRVTILSAEARKINRLRIQQLNQDTALDSHDA
jgi:putative hemolysin